MAQSTASSRPQQPQIPVIDLARSQHYEVVDAAAKALADAAADLGLYAVDGSLAELHGGAISYVTTERGLVLLSQAADWVRKGRVAKPDRDVARALIDRAPSGVPRLHRIYRGPVVTADGRPIFNGYDAATGIMVLCSVCIRLVNSIPTPAEVAKARDALLDVVANMPFVDDASCAHAIAMIITPAIRPLIDGLVPMYAVIAPTPGTGKGLLAAIPSRIHTGSPPTPTTLGTGAGDEEIRRQLVSVLKGRPEFLLLDNQDGRLDSRSLAAILTSSTYSDRIVRTSTTVTVENTPTWIVTGNGLQLSNELARRSAPIRLDARMEKPQLRTGWRHHPLLDWVDSQRGELLWAILTLVRAWLVAGRPAGGETLGSFERWAEVVGGILNNAGIQGFLCAPAIGDPEEDVLRAVVAAWWAKHGGLSITASDVVVVCDTVSTWPAEVSRHRDHAQRVQAAGRWLTALDGRVVGGLRLVSSVDGHSHARRYQLVQVSQ